MKNKSILCLDIGEETQDVLVCLPDCEPAEWPQFELPSPARCVAEHIRGLSVAQGPVHISGKNVEGWIEVDCAEEVRKALQAHIQSGGVVTLAPQAAVVLHMERDIVPGMRLAFADNCPPGSQEIEAGAVELSFLQTALRDFGCVMPQTIAVAAWDHGEISSKSHNARMSMWREFLSRDHGALSALVHGAGTLPRSLARLHAIQACTGGPVADSGAVALLGALCLPEVEQRSWREGITVLYVNRQHTLAFLLYQGRVWGVYEQHTRQLTLKSLQMDLDEFRLGWLPDEVVRGAGGHGCALLELPPEAEGFRPTFVFGPHADVFPGLGKRIHPGGSMAKAGVYGLVYGLGLWQAP